MRPPALPSSGGASGRSIGVVANDRVQRIAPPFPRCLWTMYPAMLKDAILLRVSFIPESHQAPA